MLLRQRQHGLTSVEYAVMGGIVVIAIVAALAAFNPTLTAAFAKIIAAF